MDSPNPMQAFPEFLTAAGLTCIFMEEMNTQWPDALRDKRLALARSAIVKSIANNLYTLPVNVPVVEDPVEWLGLPDASPYNTVPITEEDTVILNQELLPRGLAFVCTIGQVHFPCPSLGVVMPASALDPESRKKIEDQTNRVRTELRRRIAKNNS